MTARMKGAVLVVAALLASRPAVAQTDLARPSPPDAVLEWNAIAVGAVSTQNGVEQQRLLAITHLAVFEAVNAIHRRFTPYLGTVEAPREASAEAAAVAAAHGVLWNYLSDDRDTLDALRAASLARIPDGSPKTSGITVGEAAALALVLHRENDGSQPPAWHSPPSAEPGEWQLTPFCPPEGGLFLHWRHLKPFAMKRPDQFRTAPSPELTSRRYAKDLSEIRAVGGVDSEKRPKDRSDVARFFAAVLSQSVWNPVARQIATARRSSLSDNARLFALLNVAMNDALIAVMDSKYHYTLWRPETAIRAADTDDNPDTEPDAGFEPFIRTPCHPSFPSAHASASHAAREVIEQVFGRGKHFVELSSPAVPDLQLRYSRLWQITDDIDDARVYGGIHFRFDQQAGGRQGRTIGEYVATHTLRKRHRHTDHGSRQ